MDQLTEHRDAFLATRELAVSKWLEGDERLMAILEHSLQHFDEAAPIADSVKDPAYDAWKVRQQNYARVIVAALNARVPKNIPPRVEREKKKQGSEEFEEMIKFFKAKEVVSEIVEEKSDAEIVAFDEDAYAIDKGDPALQRILDGNPPQL